MIPNNPPDILSKSLYEQKELLRMEPVSLERRARRRLLGAVALAVVATCLLFFTWDPKNFQKPLEKNSKSIAFSVSSESPIMNSQNDASSFLDEKLSPPLPPISSKLDLNIKKPSTFITKNIDETKNTNFPSVSEQKTAHLTKKSEKNKTSADNSTNTKNSLKPSQLKNTIFPEDNLRSKKLDTASYNKSKTINGIPRADSQSSKNHLISSPVRFLLNAGLYLNAESAQSRLKNLTQAGIQAHVEKIKNQSGLQFKVQAGPYSSREAADKDRSRLKLLDIDTIIVSYSEKK